MLVWTKGERGEAAVWRTSYFLCFTEKDLQSENNRETRSTELNSENKNKCEDNNKTKNNIIK